jgi:purine-cytosine permease-like protein
MYFLLISPHTFSITVAIFQILSCIGWASINVIVGAQLLHAVNHNLPGYGGILIIAFATFFVTLFGYKIVHAYEFWSWIPSFIVFLIVLGEFAHSGVSPLPPPSTHSLTHSKKKTKKRTSPTSQWA